MKSDSRIVDARRRARAIARSTGRSYQQTLDEIARSVGRSDWDDFVSRPCAVAEDPIEPPGLAMPSHGGPEATSDGVHVRSRYASGWSILTVLLVVAFACLAWSRSQSEMTAAQNARLAWERTTAASSRMRSRFAGNDRTMYVLAKPMHGNVRDVRLVLVDNRPASNDVMTRVLLKMGALDTGTTTYNRYMGPDGIFRVFNRHPVARLHHRVDCDTGVDVSLETEVADDMTSVPVATIPSYRPFPTRLDGDDLRIVCAPETTDRTRRIEQGT